MGRVVAKLIAECEAELATWHGGNMRNAIPYKAETIITLPASNEAKACAIINEMKTLFETEYRFVEDKVELFAEKASFVGTTVEKGMRIITVVLNADQQDGNPYARFTATSSLLDYISANFSLQTIVKKGESYKDSKVTVLDGKEDSVPAVAKSDIAVVQRVGSGTTSAL